MTDQHITGIQGISAGLDRSLNERGAELGRRFDGGPPDEHMALFRELLSAEQWQQLPPDGSE